MCEKCKGMDIADMSIDEKFLYGMELLVQRSGDHVKARTVNFRAEVKLLEVQNIMTGDQRKMADVQTEAQIEAMIDFTENAAKLVAWYRNQTTGKCDDNDSVLS